MRRVEILAVEELVWRSLAGVGVLSIKVDRLVFHVSSSAVSSRD